MAGHLYQFVVGLDDKVSGPAKHAEGGIKGLGEAMGKVKTQITVAVAAITNAFESLKSGDVGEAIQSVGEGLAGAAKLLDMVVPGLGEAVSALIEVGSLGAGLFASMIQKGIELSLEAGEATEKLSTMFEAMTNGAIPGDKVIDMLDDMSASVGMTRAELAPLAKEFMAMGVRDLPTLQKTLKAAAAANALFGDEGAKAFAKLTRGVQTAMQGNGMLKMSSKQLGTQLTGMGLDINDVAKEMKNMTGPQLAAGLKAGTIHAKEFGDALDEAMSKRGEAAVEGLAGSFDFIKKMFNENIKKIFEGVDTKPFTEALKNLVSIFGQNTASGKAMGFGIKTVFDAIFSIMAKVIPYIKKGIYEIIIAALKLYIFFKPLGKEIKALWTEFHGAEKVKTVLKGLLMMLLPIVVVVALFAVGVLVVVGALVAFSAAMLWVVGAILEFIVKSAKSLTSWSDDAKTAASDFIDGLIQGISDGIGDVVKAVTDLGTKIKTTIKSVLGTHSPSVIMAEVGMNVTQGLKVGMAAGAPSVNASAKTLGQGITQNVPTGMAAVPDSAFSPGSYGPSNNQSKSSDSSGGGDTIHVQVQIDGAGKAAMEITEEMVATVFERVALTQGL